MSVSLINRQHGGPDQRCTSLSRLTSPTAVRQPVGTTPPKIIRSNKNQSRRASEVQWSLLIALAVITQFLKDKMRIHGSCVLAHDSRSLKETATPVSSFCSSSENTGAAIQFLSARPWLGPVLPSGPRSRAPFCSALRRAVGGEVLSPCSRFRALSDCILLYSSDFMTQ
jgi:hypothetical protein